MPTGSKIELGEGTVFFLKDLDGANVEVGPLKASAITTNGLYSSIDEWDDFTCIRNPMEATFECTIKPRQMIKFIFKTCGFWFGVRFLARRLFNKAKIFVTGLFKKETKND